MFSLPYIIIQKRYFCSCPFVLIMIFIEYFPPIIDFRSSLCFVNLPRSIISLSAVSHPWDETKSMPYFKEMPPHVIIFL